MAQSSDLRVPLTLGSAWRRVHPCSLADIQWPCPAVSLETGRAAPGLYWCLLRVEWSVSVAGGRGWRTVSSLLICAFLQPPGDRGFLQVGVSVTRGAEGGRQQGLGCLRARFSAARRAQPDLSFCHWGRRVLWAPGLLAFPGHPCSFSRLI